MTFSTLVDERAAENPAGLAVADSNTSLTNADLLARVGAVAWQLADRGIMPSLDGDPCFPAGSTTAA